LLTDKRPGGACGFWPTNCYSTTAANCGSTLQAGDTLMKDDNPDVFLIGNQRISHRNIYEVTVFLRFSKWIIVYADDVIPIHQVGLNANEKLMPSWI